MQKNEGKKNRMKIIPKRMSIYFNRTERKERKFLQDATYAFITI